LDRLFLDANVLFSAAYRADSGLRRLWNLPQAELLTSAYALEEAGRHLDSKQRRRLGDLAKALEVLPEAPVAELPPGLALREKDVPILAAAIAAAATHLITGDRRDFGALFGKKVGGVLILPPRDYLRRR
jgi:predicted nucleic acid-binding protein